MILNAVYERVDKKGGMFMEKEEILEQIKNKERRIENFQNKIASLQKEVVALTEEYEKKETEEGIAILMNKPVDEPADDIRTLPTYESIIILNPHITEADKERILEDIKARTNVTETEDLGIKRLAYQVYGNDEGYYYRFVFKTSPGNISEIEKYYREENEVLKFIVVRLENDI